MERTKSLSSRGVRTPARISMRIVFSAMSSLA
jgi:hypothetical protein